MFVNYFRRAQRDSPLNLVVARVLIGGYVIWKTVWYDWRLFVRTPFTLAGEPYTALTPPMASLILPIEKWALIGTMVLFIFGYRLLVSSYVGALLLGHLGAIRYTLDPSGATTALFIAVWFLVLFGLFHEQSSTTAEPFDDGLQSTPVADRFPKTDNERFPMQPLRWSLLSVALLYFGAGFLKAVKGPLYEWATVENLSRTIIMMNATNDVVSGIGPHIVEYPLLVLAAAVGTVVIELGFLIAVLLGVSIAPFVAGIFAMQLIIGFAMGPFFFDIYPLLLVFFAWDDVVRALERERRLTVVYDERCSICARSLVLFKLLDVRGSIDFSTRDEARTPNPEQESVGSGFTIGAFSDGVEHRDYFAVRELLNQFRFFSWLVWVMGLGPLAAVGERLWEAVDSKHDRRVTRDFE